MQIYLADEEVRENLYPFSLMRRVADIRIGILTIREKWQHYLGREIISLDIADQVPQDGVIFSANIIPSQNFVDSLHSGSGPLTIPAKYESVKIIQFPWHIFQWNDWALRNDFDLLTAHRQSEPIPTSVSCSHPENIFIEAGAHLSHCVLNAESGPIYVGLNATIMEGTTIRGPVAVCEGAVVKMGSRIYGATTIGPYSVAGGEIKNSVIMGYSNKAHDGYMGDSVIGEWCNWGAGSTNSNLKNNAAEIRVWNPHSGEFLIAGNKCGIMMGDYSQCAINTSFNTGTITGICSNIFGNSELTPKYIPSFSWGAGKYEFEKALVNIANWKKLKDKELSEEEIQKLKHIFDQL